MGDFAKTMPAGELKEAANVMFQGIGTMLSSLTLDEPAVNPEPAVDPDTTTATQSQSSSPESDEVTVSPVVLLEKGLKQTE